MTRRWQRLKPSRKLLQDIASGQMFLLQDMTSDAPPWVGDKQQTLQQPLPALQEAVAYDPDDALPF